MRRYCYILKQLTRFLVLILVNDDGAREHHLDSLEFWFCAASHINILRSICYISVSVCICMQVLASCLLFIYCFLSTLCVSILIYSYKINYKFTLIASYFLLFISGLWTLHLFRLLSFCINFYIYLYLFSLMIRVLKKKIPFWRCRKCFFCFSQSSNEELIYFVEWGMFNSRK